METEVTLMMVIVGIIKILFSKRSSNVLLHHFFDRKFKNTHTHITKLFFCLFVLLLKAIRFTSDIIVMKKMK